MAARSDRLLQLPLPGVSTAPVPPSEVSMRMPPGARTANSESAEEENGLPLYPNANTMAPVC